MTCPVPVRCFTAVAGCSSIRQTALVASCHVENMRQRSRRCSSVWMLQLIQRLASRSVCGIVGVSGKATLHRQAICSSGHHYMWNCVRISLGQSVHHPKLVAIIRPRCMIRRISRRSWLVVARVCMAHHCPPAIAALRRSFGVRYVCRQQIHSACLLLLPAGESRDEGQLRRQYTTRSATAMSSPASQTHGLPRPFGRRWAKRARSSMWAPAHAPMSLPTCRWSRWNPPAR